VRKLTCIPISSTVSPRPVDGSQPSSTAKIMISMMPTQKEGRLKPKIDPAMIVLLTRLSGRSPAYTPSGMPRTIDRKSDPKASSMVAGMRCAISSSAGCPKTKESPRLPCSALPRKTKYCS